MDVIKHAKELAATIIANQKTTPPPREENKVEPVNIIPTKKTKTMGPDNQIRVTSTNPATIIDETSNGGIDELVVISPSDDFSVEIKTDNKIQLRKTYTELSAITLSEDIKAFMDADGNYILNIRDYRWRGDFKFILRSTSSDFIFRQVYANYYVYEE